MKEILFIICFSIIITGMIDPWEEFKMKYKMRPEFYEFGMLHILYKILNCAMCFSFWTSFIMIDFGTAIIVSLATEIIQRNLLRIRF